MFLSLFDECPIKVLKWILKLEMQTIQLNDNIYMCILASLHIMCQSICILILFHLECREKIYMCLNIHVKAINFCKRITNIEILLFFKTNLD